MRFKRHILNFYIFLSTVIYNIDTVIFKFYIVIYVFIYFIIICICIINILLYISIIMTLPNFLIYVLHLHTQIHISMSAIPYSIRYSTERNARDQEGFHIRADCHEIWPSLVSTEVCVYVKSINHRQHSQSPQKLAPPSAQSVAPPFYPVAHVRNLVFLTLRNQSITNLSHVYFQNIVPSLPFFRI